MAKKTEVRKAAPPPGAATPPPPKLSGAELFVELGNQGLHSPWGFTREEFLPQLRGQRASAIYREMSDNDPIVGSVLFAIEMLLRRVDWEVEPGGEEKPDIDAADFLSTCVEDMSHSWPDFIADVLTMLPFGFAFTEIVYKRRAGPKGDDASQRSRFSDGKIGWRKFMLIPQDTVQNFVYDAHGGVQGVTQQAGGSLVTIPIEKGLLFRTQTRKPMGRSVLRNAYLPWYMKKRIEEVEGIGIERDLAGLPLMYVDTSILADGDKKAEYETIVRNIRRDEQEGVLLPSAFDESGNRLVELILLTSGGARQFDTSAVIARHARNIAMTLLQDVIMMGHEKVGTEALAGEKRDLSDTALSAWLDDIAGILNTHAVPRLLELNGWGDLEKPPEIKPGDLREEDILGFSEAMKNIAQAGFALAVDPEVENFVRRRLGLPPIDEEAATQQDEMQAKLDAALAQAAALQTPPPPAGAAPPGSQPPPPPGGPPGGKQPPPVPPPSPRAKQPAGAAANGKG